MQIVIKNTNIGEKKSHTYFDICIEQIKKYAMRSAAVFFPQVEIVWFDEPLSFNQSLN